MVRYILREDGIEEADHPYAIGFQAVEPVLLPHGGWIYGGSYEYSIDLPTLKIIPMESADSAPDLRINTTSY